MKSDRSSSNSGDAPKDGNGHKGTNGHQPHQIGVKVASDSPDRGGHCGSAQGGKDGRQPHPRQPDFDHLVIQVNHAGLVILWRSHHQTGTDLDLGGAKCKQSA